MAKDLGKNVKTLLLGYYYPEDNLNQLSTENMERFSVA
jgi:hypothetical protein